MKEGKIKDSCIVIAGQSPNGSAYNENAVGVEFHQGKKAFGDTYLQPSGVWTTEVTKLAEPLDILMSVRAPVGPTNITDRQICIGRGLAAIRCKEGILHKYVFYALKNIESRIVGNDGAVFNSINKTQIEDLPLPKISLSEQERIVSYLDAEFAKIDALKANIEQQLQASKDLFQSALKEFLTPKEGWEEKKLVEVVSKIVDGSHNPPKGIKESEYKMLSSRNIENAKVLGQADVRFLSKEDFEIENKRTKAKVDDVVLTIVGTIGRSAVLSEKDIPVTFQRSVAIMSPKDGVSSRYLMYYFISNASLLNKEAQGVAQKGIYLNQLKNIPISFPSLSEQERIAAILDSLSAKIKALQENYNKALVLCNDLKQSLLKSIFE